MDPSTNSKLIFTTNYIQRNLKIYFFPPPLILANTTIIFPAQNLPEYPPLEADGMLLTASILTFILFMSLTSYIIYAHTKNIQRQIHYIDAQHKYSQCWKIWLLINLGISNWKFNDKKKWYFCHFQQLTIQKLTKLFKVKERNICIFNVRRCHQPITLTQRGNMLSSNRNILLRTIEAINCYKEFTFRGIKQSR